jgi:hypothetical protein
MCVHAYVRDWAVEPAWSVREEHLITTLIALLQILAYHVVDTPLSMDDLAKNMKLPTLAGDEELGVLLLKDSVRLVSSALVAPKSKVGVLRC